jgi:ascorbate-specific PTS system EIIC-type component UlaA
MKKLPKKILFFFEEILTAILIALVIFIVLGIVLAIFLEITDVSGYTNEELRILCNSHDYREFGLDLFHCMKVW